MNTLESVKRRGITLFTLGALSLEPTGAFAHAFGERYDLPVPMSWVILAACCVMGLTVLFAVFWPSKVRTQQALEGLSNVGESTPKHPSNISPFKLAFGWAGMLLLVLCFLCANLGTQDPLMNFAPTFIWIIWWLGTSFGVVVFGNFWPCINPWLAIDRVINPSNKSSVLSYPKHLGQWPGVFVLLCWCALEVVYPIAAMPERLSWWIVAYSCYMLLGLSLFGQDIWCAKADGFSIYFEWLASQRKERVLVHTKDPHTAPDPINFSTQLSEIAFVIAMFASVLFDGLHASQMWPPLEATVMRWGILSHDLNGYQLGVWELVCVWFLFVCMYLLSCAVTSTWMRLEGKTPLSRPHLSTLNLATHFSWSLIPIAIAYLLAHNFSTFFIQAQSIIALSSDPFGWQWDLLGTSRFEVDVSVIDAKLTWYVATVSIVLGHMVSIVKSHQCAQALIDSSELHSKAAMDSWDVYGPRLKAWKLSLPLTVLMIAFTALSLSIIAEPLANG